MTKFLKNTKTKMNETDDARHKAADEMKRFLEIRTQVFDLMAEADRLADLIRQKAKN